MSDIKTINVDGISYNINLPDNSTVNGLTVTGTLTASNITTSKIDTTSFKLSSRVTSYDLTIQEDQGYVPTVYGAYLNCLLENNLHISAPQIDISSQSINCVSTVATFSGVTASVINGTLLVGDNLSCNNINNFTPWSTEFQEIMDSTLFASISTTSLKNLTSIGSIAGSSPRHKLLLLYVSDSGFNEAIALPPIIIKLNNGANDISTYNYYTVTTITPQLVGLTGNMTYFIHVRIQNSTMYNQLKASLFITKEWGDGSEFNAFKSDMGWSSVYLYYKIL